MSDNVTFSEPALRTVQRILKHYPEGRQKSAILPVLHIAQAEFDGWLPVPVMDYVASLLKIQPIEVYEVATFYSMFNTKPVGKCVIEVCRTGPCWLMGAEELVKYIEEKLGIGVGETTADGMFTLRTVECLASCGTAPVMQIGEKYHERLTPETCGKVLDEYRARGERVTHWSRERIEG